MLLIVFEGIDGSGKTTVSNQVAKSLRARGLPVEHVRESGSFASPLVNRMREFGKDARNMAMTPEAELFFNLARDVQLSFERIRPALARDQIVIADRYLYSCQVLARFGRGMPEPDVRAVTRAAAAGLWPDVVYLMDLDPYIARARRRVAKLLKKSAGKSVSSTVGGSRKQLRGGLGMQHRLRRGYLELASADPDRWTVVDNGDPTDPHATLQAVVNQLTDHITTRWQDRTNRDQHVLGEIATVHRAPSRPSSTRATTNTEGPQPAQLEQVPAAFYRMLRLRATREPDVSAYFLARLDDPRAWQLREAWADRCPELIAYGLRGLDQPQAWQLRERLAERVPRHVARSLGGQSIDAERAHAMRRQLLDQAPLSVLATLTGDDSDDAWSIRDHLVEEYLDRVVASLAKLDHDRAWQLRERYSAGFSDLEATPPTALSRLVKSLRGLSGDRSWQIRDRYLDMIPTTVLSSLDSLEDPRAWHLRQHYVEQAPRIVLRTFDGSLDERAWEMRERYAPRVKEALDSMDDLDHEHAWRIRRDCLDTWPSTVVKSMGQLGLSDRGRVMVHQALERYPANISLLRHLTRLATWADESPSTNRGEE